MVEIVGLTRNRTNAARPDRLFSGFMREQLRRTILFASRAVRNTLLPGRPPPGPEKLHEIDPDAPDRTTLLNCSSWPGMTVGIPPGLSSGNQPILQSCAAALKADDGDGGRSAAPIDLTKV